MRCVKAGHKIVQVLASSSICKACERRKDNAFLWLWRNAEEASAAREGKEME
jgi:hypothetical protein